MTIISPRAGVTSHSEGEIVTGTVALPLGATVATCPVLMALLKALKVAVVLMVAEREPLVAEVEALGEVAEARTCRVNPRSDASTGSSIVEPSVRAEARKRTRALPVARLRTPPAIWPLNEPV